MDRPSDDLGGAQPRSYAVIFTNRRRAADSATDDAYDATAEQMVALARAQPGFLGIDSVRGADGVGITVSYWESEEAIAAWRAHAEHTAARERGRRDWYEWYDLRVAVVNRRYGFEREAPVEP